MSDFTYQMPDSNDFLKSLFAFLKREGDIELTHLLNKATCSVSTNNEYSEERWNAKWTEVLFYVPFDQFDLVSSEMENRLLEYCNRIMPKDAGYDVMRVSILPQIGGHKSEKTLEEEIREVSESLVNAPSPIRLPSDLTDKGREMAEIYFFLYCAENVLRLFIQQVASDTYGSTYFSQLTVSRSIRGGIAARKQNEEKNKWLCIRGDSELFYLDFKELGDMIINNWSLFERYYPDQAWIRTKIEEMAHCRNLIAHNSYVENHEREVIRLNFRSIVRQLEQYMN